MFFICSFKTLSDPGLLLFLRFFVAFKISSFDIGWFISSFISTRFSSNSISWNIWSILLLHVFKVLKNCVVRLRVGYVFFFVNGVYDFPKLFWVGGFRIS